MNPATIIREAQADGVKLVLSPAGTIKVAGDGAAVNRWLAMIREHKAEIIDVLKVGAGAATSRWWLISYPGRDVEVACYPEATRAEILERHPDAVAAKPLTTTVRQPSAPMTPDEEKTVRRWLSAIGEHDETTIAEVIDRCQRDADARDYFLRAAAELPAAALFFGG
jgi:hypothetical protein